MGGGKSNQQSAQGFGIAQADGGGVATVNITQVYQAATPTPISAEQLEAAEHRLQSMPLDLGSGAGRSAARLLDAVPSQRSVRWPGKRPTDSGSTLKAGGAAAVGQSAAVTGLGGIGKSQLASEFVYCYGQYFAGGVFWLSCADPKAIPAEIATAGRHLGLHADCANLPLDGQVNLVASAWQSDLPRLLVLDNCKDEAILETWLPRGGGCRVLVTSRRQEWRADLGVQAICIDVLSRAESVTLLCKHRPDLAPDDAALDAIAEELGDLPLALHLAGSFLARYRHAPSGQPAAYLEAVRRPDLLEHRSLTIEGASPTGHEQHVARTFAMSYDQLQPSDQIDAMALVALARAAWFAPGEPIPRSLLRASAGVDAADEAAVLRFEDGLNRLRELGLISEQEDGPLALHRLPAAFVRSEVDEAAAHRGHVEAAMFADAARLNKVGYPAPLLSCQPQLRFVAERAVEMDSEIAAALLNQLGFHLRMVAEFKEAKAAYERALAISQTSLGTNHPDVSVHVNNLGDVLHVLGELTGAKAAYERALVIAEASFGVDHPNFAKYQSNLGVVLYSLGDLESAKTAFEQALRISEASVMADHTSIAIQVNNLGAVLKDLGDLSGAKAAYERALKIDEACCGADHPNVARDVNNLGSVLRALDDLDGAKTCYERALAIDETSFGADHPNVAVDANNLAGILKELADLSGAKAGYERALKIDEANFGPEHPNVAIRINNLGSVLRRLGDLAGAKAAFERALKIDEASFGADHPNVAVGANNLAGVLKELGDLSGAKAALERALAICEHTLGPDHPNTRMARRSLERLDSE